MIWKVSRSKHATVVVSIEYSPPPRDQRCDVSPGIELVQEWVGQGDGGGRHGAGDGSLEAVQVVYYDLLDDGVDHGVDVPAANHAGQVGLKIKKVRD